MATAPVKPPLHNFPKKLLQWNTIKEPAVTTTTHCAAANSPSPSSSPPSSSPPSSSFPVGSRSSRPRRTDRDSPKPHPDPEPVPALAPAPTHGPEDYEKHWNLRPRRAATKASAPGGAGDAGNATDKLSRLREGQGSGVNNGNGGCGGVVGGSVRKENERRKLWIALSRDEIEEDIYSMTGSKPSRRPKRRPKSVQKQLDNVFPGLWLVGLSPESYRSFEAPPKK